MGGGSIQLLHHLFARLLLARLCSCGCRHAVPLTFRDAVLLDCAEGRCEQYQVKSLEVVHVCGDPRSRSDMKRLIDVGRFQAAIVVCGECISGHASGLRHRVGRILPGCLYMPLCCCWLAGCCVLLPA